MLQPLDHEVATALLAATPAQKRPGRGTKADALRQLGVGSAADLQALCWGSLGACAMIPCLIKGYLLDAGGYRTFDSISPRTQYLIETRLGLRLGR